MQTAEQLFHDRGYAESSIEDIAQAVGILKGSLYYYMNSKEDLLYRIVIDVHESVDAKLEQACSRTDLPPLQRLLNFIEDQAAYNAKHVTQIAVYHHEWQRLEGKRHAETRERRRKQHVAVVGLLEEAQRHP
jgi:AcrR family transcriptional regulator